MGRSLIGRCRSGVQASTNDFQQLSGRGWFLEEILPLFQGKFTPGDVRTVTAGENDPEPGCVCLQTYGQLAPADATGHHHIGQQQIDRIVMFLPNVLRRRAVRCLQNMVASRLQYGASQPAYRRLVLDQQDGFRAAQRVRWPRSLNQLRVCRVAGGEEHLKVHTMARLVVHLDPTVVLFDNAEDRCQSQARALARAFGREKGSKIRGNASGAIPLPVSLTLKQT